MRYFWVVHEKIYNTILELVFLTGHKEEWNSLNADKWSKCSGSELVAYIILSVW